MRGLLISVLRAIRALVKEPTFSVTVIGTLSVGLAAVVTLYAFVDGVLLRPLPYAHPDRLVALSHTALHLDPSRDEASEAAYLHYRNYSRSFEGIAAYVQNVVSITDGDSPQQIKVALFTPNMFSMLGARQLMGRFFEPADELPGAPQVVIISHHLWVERYGSDPNIIGRSLELNRMPKQVVGVLPAGFDFPQAGTEVWYPLGINPSTPDTREWYLKVIGRLKDGATLQSAERDLQQLRGSLAQVYHGSGLLAPDSHLQVHVIRLNDAIVAGVSLPLRILFCVACFILLLVWANLANIFLVRANSRKHEIAIKRALGISGARLAADFLVESICLSVPAALIAIVLAIVAVNSRFGFTAIQVPRLNEARINGSSAMLLVALVLSTGLLFSFVSFLHVQHAKLADALRSAQSRTSSGRRSQGSLVAFQIAIALALLAGSAAAIHSVVKMEQVELGFAPQGVWTGSFNLPFRFYSNYHDSAAFWNRVQEKVAAVPGVTAAGAVMTVPLTTVPSEVVKPMVRADETPALQGRAFAAINLVSPGYFKTMETPVLAGRVFQPGDAASDLHPCLISRALARKLFNDEDPVGQRIRPAAYANTWYTVTGVVGDVPGERIERQSSAIFYLPVVEETAATDKVPFPFFPNAMTLVVKSRLAPDSMSATVRNIVHELDPKLPMAQQRTLTAVVEAATAKARMVAVMLTTASLLAFFLSSLGTYAVISYLTGRKRKEIGIRLALGATSRQIIQMVLKQSAGMVAVGISGGIVAAFAVNRFLDAVLFETRVSDPLILLAVSLLLFGVAMAATYVPAVRAGKVDPNLTLSSD